MTDNVNLAYSQSQAAFISSKAMALIERMRRLNFHDGHDSIDMHAARAETPCATSTNLRMVGQLLNFTELEKAWLETAYGWSRSGLALPDVKVTDEAMRWHTLGGVLDQRSAPNGKAWIEAAQRLRGLGLLMPCRYRPYGERWLSDDLMCYPAVIAVLEKRHLSHAHFLNDLLQPRLDVEEADLLFGGEHEPIDLAHVPPVIEDSYRRYRTNTPLCVTHLMALMQWWCDWTVFDVQDLLWLVGRVQLPEIRAAIQTASRIACQGQRALTGFDLLKELYAVAA
ncbi:hypothetical protein [Variovorax sp. PCZ-1]|uniref:hypothetical protein n=1 Tax=Variovorax sp. PCZ-1 TaxID=2835533 RepID=UPI001BCC5153|nr:hypothetical protein [Variovorax sp. PCZ-1]MBS7809241.1 hypothetical protein [Variovorax sp. PCZ-1]